MKKSLCTISKYSLCAKLNELFNTVFNAEIILLKAKISTTKSCFLKKFNF